jgi:hypothetical protein
MSDRLGSRFRLKRTTGFWPSVGAHSAAAALLDSIATLGLMSSRGRKWQLLAIEEKIIWMSHD